MKKILVMASVMMLGASAAWAAGTDYGTSITNSVTLSYEVGGNPQTDIPADDGAGFIVDRKVDVTVATSDPQNNIVNPGDNVGAGNDNAPLTFTVTNDTNGNQDFKLSLENLANGTATLDAGETDNIDFATDLKVCVDATCSAGDISGTNISFTEGETKTYYVFADIPVGTANGSRSSIALIATAVDDGTTTTMTDDSATADNITGTPQIVFAEAAGPAAGDTQYHGEHSALSAYEVEAAVLSATKTSCVYDDPVNGTTNPKRIPGAKVWYQLEVQNTGSADAENVEVADTLNAAFGTSATNITVHAGACPALSATNNCGARNGAAEGNTHTGAGTANVTVNFETVAAGTTECGYIEVVIQ